MLASEVPSACSWLPLLAAAAVQAGRATNATHAAPEALGFDQSHINNLQLPTTFLRPPSDTGMAAGLVGLRASQGPQLQ